MDLGARPRQAITRVLLPLLYPAIFASFAIVFADTIDDFVTVNYLASTVATQPLVGEDLLRGAPSPTPAVNAAATFMLIATFVAIGIALIVYRDHDPRPALGRHVEREGIRQRSERTERAGPLVRVVGLASAFGDGTMWSSIAQAGSSWGGPAAPRAGDAPSRRVPDSYGSIAALVLDPRLGRLARCEVHDHLEDRADVDDPLHHAGHPVLARGARGLQVHAFRTDRDLGRARRVSRRRGPR